MMDTVYITTALTHVPSVNDTIHITAALEKVLLLNDDTIYITAALTWVHYNNY